MAETTFLVFQFAGHTLALNADLTRQVVPLESLYTLPGTSGAVLGLIPAAGRILPVVDLARVAGLPGTGTPAELALVCEFGGEQLALPVESVTGLVREDDAPSTTELLSEVVVLGGYFGGGHKAQIIHPQTLLTMLESRMLSA